MRILTNAAIVSALLMLAAGFPALGQEAAEIEAYPIDFCVVSGQKLGAMGTPVDYRHEGRLVRFCCGGCIGTFQSNPEKYLAVLDQHQEKPDAESAEKAVPAKTGCGGSAAPARARGCRPGCRL
jgi:YHS domain-containing protein